MVAKADSEAPTREGEGRLTAADLGAAMAALACALNPAFVVIDTMLLLSERARVSAGPLIQDQVACLFYMDKTRSGKFHFQNVWETKNSKVSCKTLV